MRGRTMVRATVLAALVAMLLLAGCVIPSAPVAQNAPPWQSPYSRPLNTFTAPVPNLGQAPVGQPQLGQPQLGQPQLGQPALGQPQGGPTQAGRPPYPTVPFGQSGPAVPVVPNDAGRSGERDFGALQPVPSRAPLKAPDLVPGARGTDPLPESNPDDQGSLRRSDRPSENISPFETPVPKTRTPNVPTTPDAGAANDSQRSDAPRSSAPPGGGSSLPELRVTPSPVDLKVDAPRSAGVGQPVTFEIELRNTTDKPLEDVRVDCEFDEDLDFSKRPDKRVTRTFEELAAGERAVFRLTLTPLKPGRHCCGFAATHDGKEQIRRNVCVDAIERAASLSLVGPRARQQGTRAEFTIKAVNLTGKRLDKARLSLRSEAALRPFEWSQGGTQRDGGLVWDLGAIEAGEGVQLQVEFDCVQASEETELSATLSMADGTTIDEAASVTIRPRDADLRVDLTDDRDPLAVGEETTYELTVQNVGLRALDGLTIDVTLPAALDFADVEGTLDGKTIEAATEKNGAAVRVTLSKALPVDGRLSLRWRATATSAGDVRLKAKLSYAGLDATIELDEATTITPSRTASRRR